MKILWIKGLKIAKISQFSMHCFECLKIFCLSWKAWAYPWFFILASFYYFCHILRILRLSGRTTVICFTPKSISDNSAFKFQCIVLIWLYRSYFIRTYSMGERDALCRERSAPTFPTFLNLSCFSPSSFSNFLLFLLFSKMHQNLRNCSKYAYQPRKSLIILWFHVKIHVILSKKFLKFTHYYCRKW